MPPGVFTTLQVDPRYIDGHADRVERWKGIVRNDPRRAVRALGLTTAAGPTSEGDTALDSQYVISELRELSRNARGDAWKSLVDAGLVTSLCKCALTFQAAVMHKSSKLNQKEVADVAKQMHAPYFIPMEVLCNGLMSGEIPPGPTEKKTTEEVKKHWSTIMQRIWSEPSNSLEAEPMRLRVIERIVVPQMLSRLALYDPSFLGVVLNPNDLTLAVIFRYWIHARQVPDIQMNIGILVPMLGADPPPPPHWAKYFVEHPPPPLSTRLTRVLLGANKAAGSDKKKRTPGQAADLIASATAAHLEALELKDVWMEYDMFHTLFNLSKRENAAFRRAVFKSSKFWAANLKVLRKAGTSNAGYSTEPMFMSALVTYSSMVHEANEEEQEFVDMLIFNWVNTGLFDVLEQSRDMIVKIPRGCMILTNILVGLDKSIPKLTVKTLNALRAQFPRPWLTKRLMELQLANTDGEREKLVRDFEAFQQHGANTVPQSSVWGSAAWQLLASIEGTISELGKCTRRGCENKVPDGSAEDNAVCGACKITKYCSMSCLESDKSGHSQICGWLNLIDDVKTPSKGRAVYAMDESEPQLPGAVPAIADGGYASASGSSPAPPDLSGMKLGDLD